MQDKRYTQIIKIKVFNPKGINPKGIIRKIEYNRRVQGNRSASDIGSKQIPPNQVKTLNKIRRNITDILIIIIINTKNFLQSGFKNSFIFISQPL